MKDNTKKSAGSGVALQALKEYSSSLLPEKFSFLLSRCHSKANTLVNKNLDA
ncbi:hypothetical protein [Alloprevotella rava]|uniref:hypothetical protein n=1 Tax=Alloprevotella rava TaxID=671218 RepID=UPI0012FC867C|nr:hypothetical protein [Alloprevotella rava]